MNVVKRLLAATAMRTGRSCENEENTISQVFHCADGETWRLLDERTHAFSPKSMLTVRLPRIERRIRALKG